MIIKDYLLRNSYLDIKANTIDFTKKGVYVFSGKNGEGKSSFIKDVVFNDLNVKFENKDFYKQYEESRMHLFSYVPQDIPCPEVIGKEYIKKDKTTDDHLLSTLMDRLYLESSILKEKVNKLSGGERTKLYIIGMLLKNTPFIFLDEPTNSLDDKSTKQLIALLKELGEKKQLLSQATMKGFNLSLTIQLN